MMGSMVGSGFHGYSGSPGYAIYWEMQSPKIRNTRTAISLQIFIFIDYGGYMIYSGFFSL